MCGVYLDGELIDVQCFYVFVWMVYFYYIGLVFDDSKVFICDYLLNKICECLVFCRLEFYYNIWGMQCVFDELCDVLIYENFFWEIEYVVDFGVDIFVLDDGWQEKYGDWILNCKRFFKGFVLICEKLE